MTDRVVLSGLVFQARHGVEAWEKEQDQRFEIDVEVWFDLQPAGLEDDLAKTVDYAAVYGTVRQIVESTTFNLIEALAEAIAHEVLAEQPLAREVVVRVRKPEVRLGGALDHAAVEIHRTRSG